MKSYKTRVTIIIVFFFLFALTMNGQPLPTRNGGGSGTWVGGSAAPIDGGVSILLALGAAYGLKRWNKKKE
jgi:hypothetical protein